MDFFNFVQFPTLTYSLGESKDALCFGITTYEVHNTVTKAAQEKLDTFGGLTDCQMKLGYGVNDDSNIVYVASSQSPSELTQELYSYLLPMLQYVGVNQRGVFYSRQQRRCGPIIIIVCSSARHRRLLKSEIDSLLEKRNCFRNPINVKYQDAKDTSVDCDIMIVHAKTLPKLLEKAYIGTRLFERLRYFVLEEFNKYGVESWDIVKNMVTLIKENEKIRPGRVIPVVARGTEWTNQMEKFCFEMFSNKLPIMYFDSLKGIVSFANIRCEMDYVEDDYERQMQLINLIKENKETHACIVIACKDYKTADFLDAKCTHAGIPPTEFGKGQFTAQGKIVLEGPGIFIISDDLINDIFVKQCTNVISYDDGISETFQGKKQMGKYRPYYLWNQLPIATFEAGRPIIRRHGLLMNYLVNENDPNFTDLRLLADGLHNVKIHPRVELFWKKEKEEYLATLKLCKNIKLFGACDDPSCSLRHEFITEDLVHKPIAPFHGEIVCNILSCTNPSQYKALMLNHYVYDGRKRVLTTNYVDELKKRKQEMTAYFTNQIYDPVDIVKDDSYGLLVNEEYFRVKIMTKSVPKGKSCDLLLDVICIDTNKMMRAQRNKLLPLPKNFKEWPSFIVNLILTNIAPRFNELEYSRLCIDEARRLINCGNKEKYTAKVWVSVRNTAWVTPIVSSNRVSIRNLLLHDNYVSCKPNHLEHIINCVKQFGESYGGHAVLHGPNKSSEQFVRYYVGDTNPECKVQWAYIKKSTLDDIHSETVRTTYAYNPWLFYGVLRKYGKLLKNLEDDLNTCLKDVSLEQDEKTFANNLCVAVRDNNSDQSFQWLRGMIVKRAYPVNMSEYYSVFLVDYGEILTHVKPDDIIPLQKRFITSLPFQSIAFALRHIQPNDGEEFWDLVASNEFIDKCFPGDNGISLDVAVYGDESRDDVPSNYYTAIGFLNGDEIGTELANRSYATITDVTLPQQIITGLRKLLCKNIAAALPQTDFSFEEDTDDEDNPLANYDVVLDPNAKCGMFTDLLSMMKTVKDKEANPLSENKENDCPGELAIVNGKSENKIKIPEDSGCFSTKPGIAADSCSGLDLDSKFLDGKNVKPKIGDLHPTTLWHQTETTVTLTVLLVDIEEFTVEIIDDARTVSFRCIKPKNYAFKVRLFGKLKKYETQLTGPCLKIVLEKKAQKHWSYLLFDKNDKHIWLKHNPDKLEYPDEGKEKLAEALDFKRRMKQQRVEFDENGTKADSDDEDNAEQTLIAENFM